MIFGSILCIAVYSFFPMLLITLFVGAKYLAIAPFLWKLSVMAVLYAFINMILVHRVLAGDREYAYFGLVFVAILSLVLFLL